MPDQTYHSGIQHPKPSGIFIERGAFSVVGTPPANLGRTGSFANEYSDQARTVFVRRWKRPAETWVQA